MNCELTSQAAMNMVPMWANGGNPTGQIVAFPHGTHIEIWKVASYGCYMGNQWACNMGPIHDPYIYPTGQIVAFPHRTHIEIWKVASYGCYMGNRWVCNICPYITHVFPVYILLINLEWYSHIIFQY